MRFIALLAIRFYQRFLSPHKGFCCAYGAYTGNASCSNLGYRAVSRFGVWQGLQVLDKRLDKCGVAYRRYRMSSLNRQAGFCDVPCDLSDGVACEIVDICKVCGECSDGLDFCGGSEKKRKRDERDVYVPPQRARRRAKAGAYPTDPRSD